jgi:hypothetical protein
MCWSDHREDLLQYLNTESLPVACFSASAPSSPPTTGSTGPGLSWSSNTWLQGPLKILDQATHRMKGIAKCVGVETQSFTACRSKTSQVASSSFSTCISLQFPRLTQPQLDWLLSWSIHTVGFAQNLCLTYTICPTETIHPSSPILCKFYPFSQVLVGTFEVLLKEL